MNKNICKPPCKHKKCECGHCKDYHLFNKYECDQLDRETLKVCGCKLFKKTYSKPTKPVEDEK